ncbi:MAG: histidine kinase [Actinomycetota bacterium]
MTDRQLVRLGRVVSGLAMTMSVGGLIVAIAADRWELAWGTLTPVNATVGIGFGALTWTVLPRQPRNRSVWAYGFAAFFGGLYSVCMASAVFTAPPEVLDQAELAGAETNLVPADLPWPTAIAFGTMTAIWVLALIVPLSIGLLFFPNGRLPSPRWRYVGWYQATTLALAVVFNLVYGNRWSTEPLTSANGRLGFFVELAVNLAILGALASVASLVVRYRNGDAEIRHQIRWIAFGGALLAVILLLRLQLDPNLFVENFVNLLPLALLIGSFWVAISKYRLYEIDSILSKSATYLGLAVVIVGLYSAVVVGVPLLVFGGSQDDDPGLLFPIMAAAVVAVVFEPVRARLQRLANRMVYGDRASPHDVLSNVTSSLSATGPEEGTAGLARLLVMGTGADQAIVRLATGDVLRVGDVFPRLDLAAVEPTTADALPNDDRAASQTVVHRGELFGSLTIVKPANDLVTPADRALLADVAAGAGLLLRNIALNSQLEQRAVEVRASRRRLITTLDAERRRLERNLHDGAQQQVVALKVKLGIAKTVAGREGADDIVDHVVTMTKETQQAVDALRAVAHGIYPPLLDSDGLEAALRAMERSSPVPFTATAPDLGRYGRQSEQTAYFCVLETIDRAQAAGAAAVRATVAEDDGGLVVRIDIEGADTEVDLASVSDRVEAFGGSSTVETGPGDSVRLVNVLSGSEFDPDTDEVDTGPDRVDKGPAREVAEASV